MLFTRTFATQMPSPATPINFMMSKVLEVEGELLSWLICVADSLLNSLALCKYVTYLLAGLFKETFAWWLASNMP